jgi:aminoglycoside phosphotransferase (APT) family kinase protein
MTLTPTTSPATPFPTAASALTAEWLSSALGTRVTSFEVEPVGVGVGLVCDLVRVYLSHDGDGPTSIIAKFPSASEENRFVALVLNMYGRETRFYRELASDTPLSAPRCHAVERDADADEFVLLLEDLEGARVVDQLDGIGQADAELAIDQLARLHACWWNHPRLESVPRLCDSPYPEAVAAAFAGAWEPIQQICTGLVTPPVKALGDRFVDLIPVLMAKLSEPPWTLSHGDYRLDNLFFSDDPDRPLVAIDWQLYDRSRGPRDLSYLLSQSMEPALRAACESALVERYVAALAANGVADYGFEQAWADYRLATLFDFCYPVIAGGGLNLANDRAVELARTIFARFVAAFEHLDCVALA